MTLSKLINKAVEEWNKQFCYTEDGSNELDWNLFPPIQHNGKDRYPEIISFLTKCIKEAYKLGKQQPHNTFPGYCCACEYDIVCMENEIEERVEKKLIQQVENTKSQPITTSKGGGCGSKPVIVGSTANARPSQPKIEKIPDNIVSLDLLSEKVAEIIDYLNSNYKFNRKR